MNRARAPTVTQPDTRPLRHAFVVGKDGRGVRGGRIPRGVGIEVQINSITHNMKDDLIDG